MCMSRLLNHTNLLGSAEDGRTLTLRELVCDVNDGMDA